MEPSLLERFRTSQRGERSGHSAVPNRGRGGILVAIIVVCLFFGVHFANDLAVILAFGWHAFFVDGVRVVNRDGVLSNGGTLPFALEFARRVWFLVVLILVLLAGLLRALLRRRR